MASNMQSMAIAPMVRDTAFKVIGGLAASCAVGALVCDVVYLDSPDFMWVTFSIWLITIGLVLAAVAALVGLVDRIVHGQLGTLSGRAPYLIGFVAVVVVSTINALVHSRDAYEAVFPEGIALSALAVVFLAMTLLIAPTFSRNRSRKAL